MHKTASALFLLFAALFGCNPDPTKQEAYSPNRQLQAYITAPAGTNALIQYNPESGKLESTQTAGQPDLLNYLPYPGNYGFIPGTLADTARGGDGQPLDVLVLAQTVAPNTLMEILPLGVVQLALPNGQTDSKILAVPARPSERILKATTYEELNKNYPSIKPLLQLWFANSAGNGHAKIMSWRNEEAAEKEVQKWLR